MKQNLIRFIIVGIFSTCLSYSIFLVALKIFHIHYILSSIISFVSTVCISFMINKNWTFEFDGSNKRIVRYFGLYTSSLLVNLSVLRFGVEVLGFYPEIANIGAIGVAACINFVGARFFVFKEG